MKSSLTLENQPEKQFNAKNGSEICFFPFFLAHKLNATAGRQHFSFDVRKAEVNPNLPACDFHNVLLEL